MQTWCGLDIDDLIAVAVGYIAQDAAGSRKHVKWQTVMQAVRRTLHVCQGCDFGAAQSDVDLQGRASKRGTRSKSARLLTLG